MNSRFRKELTVVPPVRINVTKQGLTTTIGWRGGTPALSSSVVLQGSNRLLQQIGDPRLSGPLPTDRFLIPGTKQDFGGGSLADMTSPGLASFKELLMATRRREQEIKADITKAKWQARLAWTGRALGWVSLASVAVGPLRKRASQNLALRRSEVAVLAHNLAATKISVNFDMDSKVAEPHRRMQSAFDEMAASRSWSIHTEQQIDRVKARSWASIVVSRGSAVLRRAAASLVDTQDVPLAFPVLRGKSIAYFYPGFVLMDNHQGSDFALIDIMELRVQAATTNFTETEDRPPDAKMISSTWAKANKDGSRDRRFANNQELPEMLYGCLSLLSAGGLTESFMFSNAEASAKFANATNELKQILASGHAKRRLNNQPVLERPR